MPMNRLLRLACLGALIAGAAHAAPGRRHARGVETTSVSTDGDASSSHSLSDLRRWYPKAFAWWQSAIPNEFYTPATGWLTDFKGATTPLRAVTVNGEKRMVGWVCKPGYCVDNATIMIGPGKVVGFAHFEGLGDGQKGELLLGTPSSAEMACLLRFQRQNTLTDCTSG